MNRILMAIGAAAVTACTGAASGPEGAGPALGAPSISTIAPDSFPPSTNLLPMTINGSGFPPDAALGFVPAHGAPFQSTSSRLIRVSSNQLIYKFDNSGDVGNWSVTVVAADGRRSNPIGFIVR